MLCTSVIILKRDVLIFYVKHKEDVKRNNENITL